MYIYDFLSVSTVAYRDWSFDECEYYNSQARRYEALQGVA